MGVLLEALGFICLVVFAAFFGPQWAFLAAGILLCIGGLAALDVPLPRRRRRPTSSED